MPSIILISILTAASSPCLEDGPPDMQCIPAGPSILGSARTHICDQPENKKYATGWGPKHEVHLDTYYLDTTEVTVGAYKACVRAGKCNPAHPKYSDFSHPKQPMTGVSWYDAKRFCEAHGKHLPTEAQWEKAAQGPTPKEPAEVGQEHDCTQAVVRDQRGRSCGLNKRGPKPKKGKVWHVASKPAGHYGLYDMQGNAEEWVGDWFSPTYRACGESCLGLNPKGPCDGAKVCAGHLHKIVKGGSWYWNQSHATSWHRRPHRPSNKPYHHFGFRCAATSQQAQARTRLLSQ